MNGRSTNDRRSEKLTGVFSSGELKDTGAVLQYFRNMEPQVLMFFFNKKNKHTTNIDK